MDNNCLKCDYSLICFSLNDGVVTETSSDISVVFCSDCGEVPLLMLEDVTRIAKVCEVTPDAQCPCVVGPAKPTDYFILCDRCEAVWDGKRGLPK